MGLDFTISEITESGLDSKGRQTFITTELDNFGHSGYTMMDYGLGDQDNCTTVAYDGIQFINTLNKMKERLQEINDTGTDEYNEKTDLETAIQTLQDFVDTEELTEDTERVFDIHVWF